MSPPFFLFVFFSPLLYNEFGADGRSSFEDDIQNVTFELFVRTDRRLGLLLRDCRAGAHRYWQTAPVRGAIVCTHGTRACVFVCERS